MSRSPAYSCLGALALLLASCSSSSSAPESASAGAFVASGSGATSGAPSAAGGSSSTGGASGGGGSSVNTGGNAGAAVDGGSAGVAVNGGSAGVAGAASSGTFTLTSPDFSDGSAIPQDATCATTNPTPAMPALTWTGAPAGTKSFALTFLDNTRLPSPQGMHYAMWDIPAGVSSLPKGLPAGSPPAGIANLTGAKQKNPFAAQYLGPCPNNNDNSADTYAFTLYALSQDKLPGTVTDVASVVAAIQAANPLAKAVLSGTSDAKGTLR